ncbi:MAG: hypothetical protein GTO41_08655 [Burkholderiales bacterium]|nr:hypothetical protein [Burkholderiales bacterium]
MKKWIIIAAVVLVIAAVVVIVITQPLPTITKTVDVILNIQPKPDFSLAVTPSPLNVHVGRTAVYTASCTSINNFVGEVTLSISGLPTGATATFNPSATFTLTPALPAGANIEIVIPDDDTLVGEHTLTITATSDTYE